MPFAELELKRIDKLVGGFCRNRVPERFKNQLTYIYRVENQDILIAENRPIWNKPDEWMALEFAKLKYVKKHKIWRLFWKRASGKWERYKPYSESPHLEGLLDTIKQDKHGCFFG